MDCSPLKHGGLLAVFILMMALAFVGFRGVDGLTLDEICTKLRSRDPDLKVQGLTSQTGLSDRNSILLVVNNQGLQIPVLDSYLSNANPKLALFQRGSIHIEPASTQMDPTGLFFEYFNGKNGYSDPTAYSLVLFHFLPHDLYYAMFHKTTSVAKPDAYEWTFLSSDGNINQINDSRYGYVSDTKKGSERSFTLRPLKPTDPKSKIVMSTGNVEANRFGESPIDNERWYYLDYDADSSTLTISPVPNDAEQMEKESYHSLVDKLPMAGIIYEDKVHLLNTYSGQVFVFDYQDPAAGGNASRQVSAYTFDQYFACNEDQWNSTSQTVSPILVEPLGVIQKLGGIVPIGGGILAVLIAALVGFFVYKRRSGLKSKLKSTFSSYKSSNLGKTVDKTLDRSKSTTKKASNAVESIAAKTATSARSALTSATSSAQSTAASTLSKASGSVASSSSSASSRGGSKAGSSMSSTTGSTQSAASSA